jgi:hypothetical protein
VIRGAAATASDATAASAARTALEASGSAIDAILAGFFAAAGAHPDVLFGPAIALAAGVGVGARAFDGRPAQPGRGAPRPRGFVDEKSVPDAAYVAVPRSLGMLVLLHGYLGRSRLKDLVRAGIAAAESAGANARAAVLREVGSLGAVALRVRDVERALLGAGGPVAGGVLTAEDLAEVMPAEATVHASPLGNAVSALRTPWPIGELVRPAEVIVACDVWGAVAALAYTRAGEGVAVPELELILGRDAIPVRRGVPRVAPGTLLPAAAPIAIVQRGGTSAAVGLSRRQAIEVGGLATLLDAAMFQTTLDEVRAQAKADTAVAVLRDERDGRAIQVGPRAA